MLTLARASSAEMEKHALAVRCNLGSHCVWCCLEDKHYTSAQTLVTVGLTWTLRLHHHHPCT
jgi:hypothetical protein